MQGAVEAGLDVAITARHDVSTPSGSAGAAGPAEGFRPVLSSSGEGGAGEGGGTGPWMGGHTRAVSFGGAMVMKQ